MNEDLCEKAAEYVRANSAVKGTPNMSDGFLQVGQQNVIHKFHAGTWIPTQGFCRNSMKVAP